MNIPMLTQSHICDFRIGERIFEQRINTENDETTIIDSEDESESPAILMKVTSSCDVTFPQYGDAVHGRMYMNAVEEWIYQPLPGSPLSIPFSTGYKYLIKGEVELFKTFFNQSSC